jgi:hypothetical protein
MVVGWVPVRRRRQRALGGEAVARPARGGLRPAVRGDTSLAGERASRVEARLPVDGALQRRLLCVVVPCGGDLRRGFCGGVVVGGGRRGEEASGVWRSSVGWRRRRWASRIYGVATCIPIGGNMGGGGLLLGVGVGGLPFPN